MNKPRDIALALGLACCMTVSAAWATRPLVITVYPHDELADISDEQLHERYFQHWLEEMRSFTDHPIEVIYQRSIAGLTDIDYHALAPHQLLDTFTDEIQAQRSGRPFSYMNKDLLLTQARYGTSGMLPTAGLPHPSDTTAVASTHSPSDPGHELGHLLSATHEQAQISYNGWPCESYMVPTRTSLRGNCYTYSAANRAAIRNYLRYNSD